MNAVATPDLEIDDFEHGDIDPAEFDHEAHVYVAWLYVRRLPLPQALAGFDAALQRFTQQLGVPGKYHATITWFFLLLIAERSRQDPTADWSRFRHRNGDLFDAALLRRYYQPQTLASDSARRCFVLPDRLAA